MTEQELTDGLVNKNKEAIEYLVRNYQRNVIKTACYFVGNMEDAEDLSQEIFLEIIDSVGRFRKKSSLYTWIYRITVNRSLDHLRKQKRKQMVHHMASLILPRGNMNNPGFIEPGTTNFPAEEKEKRKILDKAVNALPENQRIAFILSKYDDKSYSEIAEIMNLTISSVESLIHRAKVNLQKNLVHHFSEYAGNRK